MEQEKIGRFIAQLRKERGLTQEQLGGLLGVSQRTVSWQRRVKHAMMTAGKEGR